MRLSLTVVHPPSDQRVDLVLDCHEGTRIRALAERLPVELGLELPVTPALYAAGVALDPDLLVHASVLREGSLVGIAGPAEEQAGEAVGRTAGVEPSTDGTGLDFNRPPRLLPPLRRTRFRLPTRPVEPDRRTLPVVLFIAPLVMALAMVWAFHNWYFAVFGLLSPVSLVGNHLFERRAGRRSQRRRLADYRREKDAIEADAHSALVEERAARCSASPDPATLLRTAIGPGSRLWERRHHDPDALTIRVGTGDVASEVVLDDPEQPEHRRQQTWTAVDVPVTVPVREHGVVGLAGRADFGRALGGWVVVQSAVLHSPQDLSIWVLTDQSGRDSWQWVRWLPHARPSPAQDALALLGCDDDSTTRRVGELLQIVTDRHACSRPGGLLDEPDVLVVLDGARRLRSLPGMVQVLRDGPSVGVFAVCIDTDVRLLPEECQAVVVQEADCLRVQQKGAEPVDDVRPDLVSPSWCERTARALAPLRDVSGALGSSELPTASRLLDLLGLDPPTAAAITAGWSIREASTAAVIGESVDGPFVLDLGRDGPHGLIAGTTGAGKSELLQSLVASLAVANRPDALNFVLIDYKGGAAFAHCERLPHTVGLVTDLDSHLVERALASLGAELRRREQLLRMVGAKDLDGYLSRRRGEPSLAAMPRLVIVIDEFAALARELPDFVTGLVDIAARGRSLGIHLILATQRPGGVVSPEIRANTNLRLALRVTDTSESNDVIDAPDAGRIGRGTPGRAYARLGHGSLVAFQTARIGGRSPGAAAEDTTELRVSVADWPVLGRPPTARSGPALEAAGETTDLQALVEAICVAAERSSLGAQRGPWLPALPDRLLVDDLVVPGATGQHGLVAAFALDDLPAEQARRPAVIDLERFAHLYVVGAPRSGRSQALRSIAGSLAGRCSAADLHLYGIDCGNGALLPLAGLPHCGAVVSRNQAERATRLILRLATELRRRQQAWADNGFADLSEQRAAVAAHRRLAHVVVLLDGWEGFVSTLGEQDGGRLAEEICLLLREGASVGVHLVIAGDRALISGRMSTFTDDKLVLRLADRSDFVLAAVNPRHVPDELPPGRAFHCRSGVETQIGLLGGDTTSAGQAAALAKIAALAAARDIDLAPERRPFRVDDLPTRLSFDDAWARRRHEVEAPLWGLVGLGGDELEAHGVELRAGACSFVVAGPPRSGRSTLLLSMARSFVLGGASVVLLTPRSSPLADVAGSPGVLAVLADPDVAPDTLTEALDRAPGPSIVLVDDAELLRDCAAADVLRAVLRAGRDRQQGLVLAGTAEDLCTGFSGWQVEAQRSRQGALLSPRSATDGDLIGVRLPRSVVGGAVRPGRALVHLGDSLLRTVAVPHILPAELHRPSR